MTKISFTRERKISSVNCSYLLLASVKYLVFWIFTISHFKIQMCSVNLQLSSFAPWCKGFLIKSDGA